MPHIAKASSANLLIILFLNTLFQKEPASPCAAGMTGPLSVVAGRSTHAFLRRSLRGRSCLPSPCAGEEGLPGAKFKISLKYTILSIALLP
jgi:hypothetical protein